MDCGSNSGKRTTKRRNRRLRKAKCPSFRSIGVLRDGGEGMQAGWKPGSVRADGVRSLTSTASTTNVAAMLLSSRGEKGSRCGDETVAYSGAVPATVGGVPFVNCHWVRPGKAANGGEP
jgi:hypothetical protein